MTDRKANEYSQTVATGSVELSDIEVGQVLSRSVGSDASAGSAAPAGAGTELVKQISTRQFSLMAVSSSIGAGLLIASTSGLKTGGPAALVLAFAIVGVAVWLTMCALCELSATFPVQGSFYDYSVRFISPSWGFAMGWNFVINAMLVIPFEMTVMVFVARYWNPNISTAYLIPAFLFGLILANIFGAKWYAEAENWFSVMKATTLIIFSLTAIVVAAGGVKTDPRQGTGFEYWKEGAFLNGFTGFLWVFVNAGLAYGGTEMLGLTVAECRNPRRAMALTSKIVIGRIVLLFLLPLFMVGLIMKPSQFEQYNNIHISSPFVVSLNYAQIPVLPDLINGCILLAVFSMANASVFAASRALHAICSNGMGPRIGSKTNKKGTPLVALAAVFAVSTLAFVSVSPEGEQIFDWLLAFASANTYFTWGSICCAHIRARMAMRRRGIDVNQTTGWKSPVGIWGSVVAVTITGIGLLSLLISAAVPPVKTAEPTWVICIRQAMGFFAVLTYWTGHMVLGTKRQRFKLYIPLDHINLDNLIAEAPAGFVE